MRCARDARLFWTPAADPAVIVATAAPADAKDADHFDLNDQVVPTTVLRLPGGGEELLLGMPGQSVRVSIAKGTLLAGAVRLSFRLDGFEHLERRLCALRRLGAMRRHMIFASRAAGVSLMHRRLLLVRTLDALAADPRHRAVASALFGPDCVEREWSGSSDYLKSRVRRLVTRARQLLEGGYRDALRPSELRR